MNLLDQEEKKQEEPKGKKIVLLLLIISVLAMIIIIVMLIALSGKQQVKPLTLSINGMDIQIQEGLFITDENESTYIAIRKIAKTVGYNYLTGEYRQYNEDKTNTKCYLENTNQVVQFEAESNKIYKIDITTNLDYEEYELKDKILKEDDLLYISLDDLGTALNAVYEYLQNDNKILLNTVEDLYEDYKTSLPEQTNNAIVEISDNFNNKKAIAYDKLIVLNESGKWGVVNSEDFSTIIGNKYLSIEFIEAADVFIVSDNNKYGVINSDGEIVIELNYESVEIINNNPIYYKVKLGENYVILNEKGKLVINNVYSGIGYNSKNTLEESVLVIKELGKDKINALVVCKNEKYGLLNLNSGNEMGDCVLDKIYSKTENGKRTYYIQLQGQEIGLDKYLEYINTTKLELEQEI